MSKPAGTTMEGMIWNADHVLSLALMPSIQKGDILKEAKGVVILETVDVGLVLAGTRGSGVLMAKNADGSWSAPSAVTISAAKLGLIFGAKDKGLIFVFTEDEAVDKFISGSSVQISAGYSATDGTVLDNDQEAAAHTWVGNKGTGSVFVYTYKLPPSFEGCSLDSVVLKNHGKANERFYGKQGISPVDIVRTGDVTIPDGSGIPDLQKKLVSLENNQTVEPTPADESKKESLRQSAIASSDAATKEEGFEVEELAKTA